MSADLQAPCSMSRCDKPPSSNEAQKVTPPPLHGQFGECVTHKQLACQQADESRKRSVHLSAGYTHTIQRACMHGLQGRHGWGVREKGSSPCRWGICRQLGAQGAMHGAIEDGRQAEVGVDLPAQHPDLPQAHPKRVHVHLLRHLVLQSTLQRAGQALPAIPSGIS